MNRADVFIFLFFRLINNSHYRIIPKRNRSSPNKAIQLNNQIAKGETSENAPDYLPYSVYSNLEPLQQKPHEDIHPVRSPHAVNPKQPSLKPKKRHSRPLKLTGEVNLGTNKFNSRDRKQRIKERQRPVETVTNPTRHHHHPNDIPDIPVIETTSTATPTLPTEEYVEETTHFIERTTMSEAKRKLEEKAHRRERLKAKLAALTPEERQAFLLMKQQRADAKKKGFATN